MTVRKGVLVAAGYGTRFLPVTRVVPKELLPVVDRPAVDLVVEEFVQAGITDLLVISSRRKKALEDWFDRDPELEGVFAAERAEEKLARIAPPALRVSFVRQQRMSGTGDALLLAREFAAGDPVVVAYPDDLFGAPNATAALIANHARHGTTVLSASDLIGQDVSRYGVLDVEPRDGGRFLRRMVEKPPRGQEPSTLVSWGRYLYTPDFFEALARLRPADLVGEYFHVPALLDIAARGRVTVEVLSATRWDTGTPLGYLQAVVDAALTRDDTGPALRQWLTERLRG